MKTQFLFVSLVACLLGSACTSQRGAVAATPRETSTTASPVRGGGYQFKVRTVGDDLVVENAICTNFGGATDYEDNGTTEGGVVLRKNDESLKIHGCSLPMRGYTERHYSGADTSSSPIPALPYRKTMVEVSYGGKTLTVPLIERGPGPNSPSRAAIDLTFHSFEHFAPLGRGILRGVRFRIIGAAKYENHPYVPPDARSL